MLLLGVFACALTLPGNVVLAVTVTIVGSDGLPGSNGVDGPSGTAGSAGADGGNAVAPAEVPDDSANTATATGGNGGRGGDGGDATDLNGFGGDGGDGGNGGDATATATTNTSSPLATATAAAKGGDGGAGGDGGETGIPGGQSGGDGGNGSEAFAVATAQASTAGSPVFVSATAEGGAGGDGGEGDNSHGGDGGFALVNAVTGRANGGEVTVIGRATGGAGGAGKGVFGRGGLGLRTDLINAVEGTTTGSLILLQEAVGGDGGDAEGEFPGVAGWANSWLTLSDLAAESISATTVAVGGGGGSSSSHRGNDGDMGNATSTITGVGQVNATARASGGRGGDGGMRGGNGGPAGSGAYAVTTSFNSAKATAVMTGGRGGDGAIGGDGADISAENLVGGETKGDLHIHQSAIGGGAGTGLAGAAGNAGDGYSRIAQEQDGPKRIYGSSTAIGGAGGRGIRVPLAATARSSATVTSATAETVNLHASAFGGDGGSIDGVGAHGDAADGGAAHVDEVRAVTTLPGSTEIQAVAEVNGGSGGNAIVVGGNGGNGALADLFNTVDGVGTSASRITLAQTANGGRGGNAGFGFAGGGGDASAHLGVEKDVSRLTLVQTARGGAGGDRRAPFGLAAPGGNAGSTTIAENTRHTHAASMSAGGAGGAARGGANGGEGGDALAEARSTNTADEPVYAFAEAIGGDGGSVDEGSGRGGTPGEPQATAFGASDGYGTVDVLARELGGRGGSSASGQGADGGGSFMHNQVAGSTFGLLKLHQEARGGDGGSSGSAAGLQAGHGGHASSTLEIQHLYVGPIEGKVVALGGDGADASGSAFPGQGGRADASINLYSFGSEARAVSEAEAGRSGVNQEAGYLANLGDTSSWATAETDGGFRAEAHATMRAHAGGQALARAITTGGAIARSELIGVASRNTPPEVAPITVQTHASVSLLDPLPGAMPNDSVTSHGNIMPSASRVSDHLAGDPNVTAAFTGEPGVATALSLVAMGFNPAPSDDLTRRALAEFDFDLSALAGGRLMLGLLDPTTSHPDAGMGFQFVVWRDGVELIDVSFGNLPEAMAYFDDRVLDLGLIGPGSEQAADLSIELTAFSVDDASSFGMTMLVASVGGDTADFDDDGDVDGQDLAAWRGGFGTSGNGAVGDADGDRDVDGHDFLTWQRQVSGGAANSPISTAASAVAEPTSAVLAMLGLIPALRCRRRKGESATMTAG